MRIGGGARLSLAIGVVGLAAALCSIPKASAQDGGSTRPTVLPLSGEAEGAPIAAVTVRLRKASGNASRDRAALEAARRIAATMTSAPYSWARTQRILTELTRQDAIAGADYRVLEAEPQLAVRLEFEIDAAAVKEAKPARTGVLLGDFSAFPILYKDERTLLTTIVGGGIGGYSDVNSWFGQPALFNARNPLAGKLPGKTASWAEGYLELGLGGATQLGDSPFYGFGAVTGMFSWSLGQDVFRNDPRGFLDFEKAYGGILYVDPENTKNSLKVSVGRQTYTLNEGFLINSVRGSTNAGDRGGLYLGPRLANDFSVLANGRHGAWSYNLFYIDPNEIESLESHSTFLGANLKYAFTDNLSADATVITIPTSQSSFANPFGLSLAREGLNTVAGHARWQRAFDIRGAWLEGEVAHQSHPDYPMSAWAYYGTVGYRANDLPWTPSLSYRYAYFSGDDPRTTRYERFDPLLSTGLGIWLQGVSFGKFTSNSNLETHRVQFNLAPNEKLNLTFDYYYLRAPQLNNLGSNPALASLTSHDLGQEFSLSARWAVSKSVYLQSLVSHAIPGKALRNIGADKDWTTFQLSLYWGL
ncbi:conserved hypothetical protein [Hyphomicrobiales bacterium]|nr:conserved hypothetical protein [Hyphomicrobiales bacterium]CAH1699854.1 Alginate_exp domain-containing protein [Hyphomicrobiales bacterium]CAI0343583.1 conserved hypothetical protein [Hyphomicrobiales bacterium]